MSKFDPYFKWLGIPREDQPPDHYRLLGIPKFTSDVDVIVNAVDRRVAFVRTFALGPHSDDSQRILNELATARLCLCSPEKKTAYDNNIREKVSARHHVAIPNEIFPGEGTLIDGAVFGRRVLQGRRTRNLGRWVIGTIGIAIAMLAVIGIVVRGWPETSDPEPRQQGGADERTVTEPEGGPATGREVVDVGDGQNQTSVGKGRTQQTGNPLLARLEISLEGHTAPVTSVSFSRDGRRIVSGSQDQALKVWDTQSGRETLTLTGHAETVYSVSFSPDEKRIVSGSGDRTVKVWDAQNGKEMYSLTGHSGCVNTASFSPDGKQIVSGSDDDTLRIWNSPYGNQVLTLTGHKSSVWSVEFSKDGKRIVSGSADETVKVWAAHTGQEMLTLNGHSDVVRSVSFSPDAKRIVSGGYDDTVKVWDVQTGQQTLSLTGHSGAVYSVSFSPDSKWIVSGSNDDTLKVWDAQTGNVAVLLKGHTGHVHSVAFSPNGLRLAAACGDGSVKVWDLDTVPVTRPYTKSKTQDQPRIVTDDVPVEETPSAAFDVENDQKRFVTTLRPLWVSAYRFTTDGGGYSAEGGITVNGNPSPFGMALHPRLASKEGRVAYKIPSGYQLLAGAVAADDSPANPRPKLTFRVDGGGQLLWKSLGISGPGEAVGFCVRLDEVSEIVLTVSCNSGAGAHAVWLDPVLLKSSEGRTLEEIAESQRKRWLKTAR